MSAFSANQRRRILSLWPPRLPIDRIKRELACRKSSPAKEPGDDAPSVVVAKENNALKLYSLDDAAARYGLGIGMPLATGAAVACPDRKIITLEGDGSAMYTVQALWTQAREGLDVTTLLFSNRSYQILKGELANVGAGNPGRKALDMLDLNHPDLDFVTLAKGMGVPGARVSDMDEFNRRLAEGIASPGPYLVEVVC